MNKGNGAQKRYSERERKRQSWRGKKTNQTTLLLTISTTGIFSLFNSFFTSLHYTLGVREAVPSSCVAMYHVWIFISLAPTASTCCCFLLVFFSISSNQLIQAPNPSCLKRPIFEHLTFVRMQLISKLKMSTTKKESNTYNINKIIFTSQFLFLVTSDGMNKNKRSACYC